MAKEPTVYILTNKRNGTLYIGVTSNLSHRLLQHRAQISGFTKEHRTTRLVYLERHTTMIAALEREKRLKRWKRAWKVSLIEKHNPYWRDLVNELLW